VRVSCPAHDPALGRDAWFEVPVADMLHVVLDTNIFSRNARRDSAPFRALERLARAGMLQIHVPAVVAREFKTQQVESIETLLKETMAALKKLQRNSGDDEFGKFASDTIEAAEAQLKGARAWKRDFRCDVRYRNA
jgi:rRNA-processing protein FCF1